MPIAARGTQPSPRCALVRRRLRLGCLSWGTQGTRTRSSGRGWHSYRSSGGYRQARV